MLVKTPPRLTNRSNVIKYIEADLWTWLKQISVAFTKINFEENFISFIIENIAIDAGKEVAINNQFNNKYNGQLPVGYMVIRQKGDAHIIDGDTPWTIDTLYLKNPSANNAVVTVLFFR